MPRLARLDAHGVLHHVMGRGIERKNIFWNDKDRSDFIDRLAGVVEKGAGIYSRTGTSLLYARRRGWSAVLALRVRREKQASDTRILGDSEFVQEVTSDLDDMVKKNLRLSGLQVSLSLNALDDHV